MNSELHLRKKISGIDRIVNTLHLEQRKFRVGMLLMKLEPFKVEDLAILAILLECYKSL